MGRPAARLGDMTAHGSPLGPGPGSPNVFIGKRPAWRGITPTQIAKLADTIAEVGEDIAKGAAKSTAVGNPAPLIKALTDAIDEVTSLIISFMVDTHVCPVVKVTVPDGSGVVIDGSKTVLINGLAACRMGDSVQETTSLNKITQGEFSVKIGG